MTNSLDNLSISSPYRGLDNITIGDGSSVSIANTGAGILPTPTRTLHLSHIGSLAAHQEPAVSYSRTSTPTFSSFSHTS
ncbi:hypothetical protein M5K25_024373 [Dendrobium thyrsiflorum]|uniref:Uncharacterized protein n=1 Tax=Dendrobium thyrsiflorum TaxID=117978 RepID=A0ABD0U1Z4_DENTH